MTAQGFFFLFFFNPWTLKHFTYSYDQCTQSDVWIRNLSFPFARLSDGALGAGAREQSLCAGGGARAAERRAEAAEGSGKNAPRVYVRMRMCANIRAITDTRVSAPAQTVVVSAGRDCRSGAAVREVRTCDNMRILFVYENYYYYYLKFIFLSGEK